MTHDADVLIVGAGAAGLAAARLLGRHGLRWILCEASDRIGGRILTVRRAGWELPIELGAEFVHGRPTPTLALGGGAIGRVHVPEQRVEVCEGVRPLEGVWPQLAAALRGALQARPRDSVADYLARAHLAEPERRLVRMMVEGYHAAPLEDVSARAVAEDAAATAENFEQYRTADGYDQVLAELEHGMRNGGAQVRLLTRVERVVWSSAKVQLQVQSPDGPHTLAAPRCVITTSVGVLKAGNLRFEPEPDVFRTALPKLGMGQVVRVVLRFERRFWPESPGRIEPSFVHVPAAPFPTLWRQARAGQEQLVAWAGGPQAARLARFDRDALVMAALRSVAVASGRADSECLAALVESHYHDFISDPFTLGAYSYVRAGGSGASPTLAEPCQDTLFFAGEALDPEFPSTVAGALGSGERAARLLLRSSRHTP